MSKSIAPARASLTPMMVDLPVPVPGVRAFRVRTEAKRAGIKPYFAVGRVDRGRAEWFARGQVWQSAPGSILIKEMGDVHRDLALDGPSTCTIVALPEHEIAHARDDGVAVIQPHLTSDDRRAVPFNRLVDAVLAGADRLTIEVAVAEVVATFARMSGARHHTRPVRRAIDYLRARLGEAVTLDELAHHADLDKFHLCRAFRSQVGLPPHAYLTHLRIARARELLRAGVRASDVAPCVGLYDQSLLNRHFRRIVGTTPARYALSFARV